MPSKYQFFRAEPGILIEIYLPKRVRFQGVLFDTLKEGLDANKVLEHFDNIRKNETLRNDINSILEFYKPLMKSLEEEALDGNIFKDVFKGYSMYEVDGVFFDVKEKKEYEERTQIIKFFFVPNIKKLSDKYMILSDEDCSNGVKNISKIISYTRKFISNYPLYQLELDELYFENKKENEVYRKLIMDILGMRVEPDEMELNFIQELKEWIRYTGLFMFGYLAYNILIQIEEYGDKHDPEKELWITSNFNFQVNRAVYG